MKRETLSVEQHAEAYELSFAQQLLRRMVRPESYSGALRRSIDVVKWKRINERIHSYAERRGSDFTVVQIGANDGVHSDPVNPFIEQYGWRGVLVEPVPDHFRRLQDTYEGYDNVTLVNSAISDQEGEMTMYAAQDLQDGQLNPLRGKDSFDYETIAKHDLGVSDVDAFIEPINVPAIRLDTLLQEQGIEEIDYLAIDTEGHDGVVLSQLDMQQHRPQFVLFEHCHLEPRESDRLNSGLEASGYELTRLRRDTFAELAA